MTTHSTVSPVTHSRRLLRSGAWTLLLALSFSAGLATHPVSVLAKNKKQPTTNSSQPSTQPAPQPAKPKKAPDQPHMKRALKQLELAQYDLSQTSRGKGGWVQIAQGHVSSAISAVRQGISYGESH